MVERYGVFGVAKLGRPAERGFLEARVQVRCLVGIAQECSDGGLAALIAPRNPCRRTPMEELEEDLGRVVAGQNAKVKLSFCKITR